jgi:hypothetical protein
MKNELNTRFEQKFTTGSYRVGIGRAWCSWKAREIYSSFIQKKKLKNNYFSSYKLPKHQSTSFWSQEILGVKITSKIDIMETYPNPKKPFHNFWSIRY